MKKVLKLIIILLLIFPITVFAYSSKIIPGGKNIGIEIDYEGVLVIGFYKVNNKINNNLAIGDYIIEVNDKKVSTISDLVNLIETEIKDDKVELTIKRKNKIIKEILTLERVDGKYKTGLYVKDKISGIGTLTYIDPKTNIFGALGHEIIDSSTNKIVEVKTGSIYDSRVTSIDRSTNGNPGSKIASIKNDEYLGSIEKNTNKGIFGKYENINEDELMEVGNPKELKKGIAKIKTVLNNEEIKEYVINITRIDYKNSTKNIYFEITDEELLNETGGIVQGMSGSPIIQDNKIYGAVTHVVIDNVKKGYGIFITSMLELGEKEE